MKAYLKSTLLFCLFSAVAYPTFLYVLGILAPPRLLPNLNYRMGGYGHMHSRIAELKTVTDVDVLILGSSHAYRGYDTRILERHGVKAFNLGSSAQTPVETRVLLKRYLDRLNPDVVIFDVSPDIFQSDGVESSLDIISNDKNDVHSVRMALELNNVKTYNTLLFGLIHDLLRADRSFSEPREKGDDTYVPGGFVERRITYYRPERQHKREWSLTDRQLAAFQECTAMIAEKGINLILVYAPVTSSLFESLANNDAFDNAMRGYGSYYNFNRLMDLDDTVDFYDANHLNQIGVELFNEKLLETIQHELRGDS